jgi:microcystin synthetase protein McyB
VPVGTLQSMDNIEHFYPLSPLQEGLLYHSLSDPDSSSYFNQTIVSLRGELDIAAFAGAWQRVVDHHPVLRTFFVWENLPAPVQVVESGVRMPIEQLDWRGLSPEGYRSELDALLQRDLDRGCDLSVAPLMRLTLVRAGGGRWDFLWSFHHILMDGWSLFLVLRQVFGAYEALRAGREPVLEPSRPFRDFLVWLQRQDRARSENYWRKALRGIQAPTPLVADHPSTESGREVFDSRLEYLTAEVSSTLRDLAKQHRLTLNSILQGAWALLLSTYSGARDVLFGTVVSGRPVDLEGAESMVGLCINTLPTRVRLDAEATVLDWLHQVQAEQAEAREYAYSRLVDIQSWSEIRPPSPLFESIFLFENYHKDAPLESMCSTLEIEDVRWLERHNYPLAALAIPGPRLMLRIIYQTGRCAEDTIERMLQHWRTLLEAMVATPKARVADLALLTAAERERLVVGWNVTEAEIRRGACVHELFEEQAARTPDVLAVAGGGVELSYRELDERANQLAHRLRTLGVGTEVLVGVCTERRPDMVVGILAVLKAGGAYLPLDVGYPRERLAFMLADAGARVLLTHASLEAHLPPHAGATIFLDRDWDSIAGESRAKPVEQARSDNLAYVIYTSGSTGEPKGVELGHTGLVNLVSWHRREYDVVPADRATHLAGLAFDASVWEMWPYLTAGASLHLVPDDVRLSPPQLMNWIAEQRITISFLATPLAEAVLNEPMPSGLALRAVLTGGDKLHRAPPPGLPFDLFNHYGPTENTVVATATEVVPSSDRDAGAPAIGRPIANVEVYLLDWRGQCVPVGVPGELFIGGESLARGYHGRPELTAEKFVASPFKPGARLYATGDLARYLPDGNIEFLGRIDGQVKVRGYRIELGEIEAVLGRHAGVRDCVVAIREQEPGDVCLAAYTVGDAEPAELRSHLQGLLPDYMIPAAFMVLDTLPLTPNGKVDRRALPDPDVRFAEPDSAYVRPQGELEELVSRIWQEVLRVPRVGGHTNFFDLGGHSLHLIQVHGKLKSELGREIPMVDLFKFTTVSALARYLGDGEEAQDGAPGTDDTEARRREGRARMQHLRQRRRDSGS